MEWATMRDENDLARAQRMRATRAAWLRDDIVDYARGRTAVLNQLLLATVVFVLGGVVILTPFDGDRVLFFSGVVVIVAVTGVTFLVPWARIPYGWLALVPTVDIVAIAMLVLAAPTATLGLLWIFPATWLAAGFGLLGLYGVLVAVAALPSLFGIVLGEDLLLSGVLLPLVLLAVSITSYVNARRSDAQRLLLAKQAQLLGAVLERTRRQEQTVTQVLDAVDFGVVRVASDGRVSVSNDAHARLQGALRTEGADGIPAFRDDAATPLPREELPFERAMRGESFDGEVVWFGGPDERRALNITARRVTDTEGDDAGAVIVSRDVTAELSALRARDDLVASVSHELRTPLTSILGFLDLAIDDPEVPDRVRANLEISGRNAERLLRIIGDILSTASSTAAAVEASLEPREVDAAAVVRAAAQAAQPRATNRAITIDVTDVDAAPVWADPLRLRQVIDNLIANAIAYNKDGGEVAVGTTTKDAWTWILVRDTGRGISEAARVHLFQRYYRGEQSRTRGTGLGLAITRDIVRAHGGEIAVRSSVGVGSTFIVKLPSHRPVTTAEGADA